MTDRKPFASLLKSMPFALGTLGLAMIQGAPADAASKTITITITHVKALDKADELSAGDFYVRTTIEGEVQRTPVVSQKDDFNPDWVITQNVPAGKRNVKFELVDKDVSIDDPIDINRLANRRLLEFTVDTANCKVLGFAETYRCGQTITRAGSETKKAEISFKVDVK